MTSTIEHGRWRLSSCRLINRSQPSRQAPFEPGSDVDHGAAGDAGAGAGLQGGDADGLVGNQVPKHRESFELPVE